MNTPTAPAQLGATTGPYVARDFDLGAVDGLSRRALDLHLELYRGYVKAFNALVAEQQAAFPAGGEAVQPLDLAGHARRLGFEYNGIVLHELFFEALGPAGASTLDPHGALAEAAARSFGSVEQWTRHAAALARLRGIGWIVTVRDPLQNRLYNTWVDLHHLSVPANTRVVLAIDLWEHAFLLDFPPAQRARYFETVWNGIDWRAVEARCA